MIRHALRSLSVEAASAKLDGALRSVDTRPRRVGRRHQRPARAASARLELLEPRQLFSAINTPMDVEIFHGTQINFPGSLFGGDGHGVDPDVQKIANIAYGAAHSLNYKDRVIDNDWGSLGDPAKAGHTAALHLEQELATQPGPHDLFVIAFSRGGYAADTFVNDIVRHADIRRTEVVWLDPTGIAPFNDHPIRPIEWGGRVHNITYHDGLHPYADWLVTDEYPMPGEDYLVHPFGKTDATASHEAFPSWYTTPVNGPVCQEVIDLLNFERTDGYMSNLARLGANAAANLAGTMTGVETFYIPGGGQGLLLPVLEAAIAHGLKVIGDDVGQEIGVLADQAGNILVTAIDSPGHAVTDLLDGAGNLINSFGHDASSLGNAIGDGLDWAEHKLHDIFSFF